MRGLVAIIVSAELTSYQKFKEQVTPRIYSLADASFYLAQAHGDGFYLANFIKEKVNVFNFTVYENDSRKYHLSIQEVFRFLQLSYH